MLRCQAPVMKTTPMSNKMPAISIVNLRPYFLQGTSPVTLGHGQRFKNWLGLSTQEFSILLASTGMT